MAALDWATAPRPYQVGVDRGVLYLPTGIAWNGLVSVEEIPASDNRLLYFEGGASGISQPGNDFALSVSAFTYPKEFELYAGDGDILTKQPRRTFGLSYRIGDSKTGQIHIVYNAMAVPSDIKWQSLSNSTETVLFKWDISTKPIEYPGIRSTAHVIIDLATASTGAVEDVTDALYGTISTAPRLPTLLDIVKMFDNYAVFQVTDNGDGTWTASGPASYITIIDATTFSINTPSAYFIDSVSYALSSDY